MRYSSLRAIQLPWMRSETLCSICVLLFLTGFEDAPGKIVDETRIDYRHPAFRPAGPYRNTMRFQNAPGVLVNLRPTASPSKGLGFLRVYLGKTSGKVVGETGLTTGVLPFALWARIARRYGSKTLPAFW